MSISRNEMPSCCLRRRVGAHEAENPVGVLRQRGPGLLAVDDVCVAVALGPGAQRGQVGPGAGFGKALAPADVERWRSPAGSAASCSWLPNCAITGPTMVTLNGDRRRARWPAASRPGTDRPAPASSPGRPIPPASSAPPGRARSGCAGEVTMSSRVRPCALRDLGRMSSGIAVRKKRRASSRKAQFLGGEIQIHGRAPFVFGSL